MTLVQPGGYTLSLPQIQTASQHKSVENQLTGTPQQFGRSVGHDRADSDTLADVVQSLDQGQLTPGGVQLDQTQARTGEYSSSHQDSSVSLRNYCIPVQDSSFVLGTVDVQYSNLETAQLQPSNFAPSQSPQLQLSSSHTPQLQLPSPSPVTAKEQGTFTRFRTAPDPLAAAAESISIFPTRRENNYISGSSEGTSSLAPPQHHESPEPALTYSLLNRNKYDEGVQPLSAVNQRLNMQLGGREMRSVLKTREATCTKLDSSDVFSSFHLSQAKCSQ